MKKLLLLSLFCASTAMADTMVEEQMSVGKVVRITANSEISRPVFVHNTNTGLNLHVISGTCKVEQIVDLPSRILSGVATWFDVLGSIGAGAKSQGTTNGPVAVLLYCLLGNGVLQVNISR
jgi:hypothetical protein